MSESHSGPVALITGAGTGIGAATARLLHQRGYGIVACGRRAEPLAVLEADIGALARSVDVTGAVLPVDGGLGVVDPGMAPLDS